MHEAQEPETKSYVKSTIEFREKTTPQVLDNIQGKDENPELYAVVYNSVKATLDLIADKIEAKDIDPSVMENIRLSQADIKNRGPAERIQGEARIGLFPVAANPIHWGQLVAALKEMAEQNLSGVVFVLQGPGDTDKPEVELTMAERLEMAKAMLGEFGGIFKASTISYETRGRGEKTVFDLIGLNEDLVDPDKLADDGSRVTWAYMAGSDHEHVWKESVIQSHFGEPDYFEKPMASYDFDEELDTIGKFYQSIEQKREYLRQIGHHIEVFFNNRPGNKVTQYHVEAARLAEAAGLFTYREFNGQPFAASSTEIRKRITGIPSREAAVTLPKIVMNYIDGPGYQRYRSIITASHYQQKLGIGGQDFDRAQFDKLVNRTVAVLPPGTKNDQAP